MFCYNNSMLLLQTLLSFILGSCIGSFINAAEYRLAREEKVVRDRSRCRSCRAMIPWYDLAPIISFLLLRGKCRSCSDAISHQYPLVEAVTGSLVVGVFYLHPTVVSPYDALALLRDLIAVSAAVFLFVYDYKYMLLPDVVTIPAALIIAVCSYALGMSAGNLLLGIGIGGGFFLLQYAVSRGAWVGGGDIRYGALLGALFGWPMILVALFLSYIVGATFAVGLLLSKRKQLGQTVPFGTFLSVGLVMTLFFGQALLDWYLAFV